MTIPCSKLKMIFLLLLLITHFNWKLKIVLGLEVESLHRDNPSLDLSIWGQNKQTNKSQIIILLLGHGYGLLTFDLLLHWVSLFSLALHNDVITLYYDISGPALILISRNFSWGHAIFSYDTLIKMGTYFSFFFPSVFIKKRRLRRYVFSFLK